jgi:hypothetical protein
MGPEDFSVGQELKRDVRSCWGCGRTVSAPEKRPDAIKSSNDAGIGPLQCMSRVVGTGSRIEHRLPYGDRICGRELASRNPIGDDLGDLPCKSVDLRLDYNPRLRNQLHVHGEQFRIGDSSDVYSGCRGSGQKRCPE